jgi:hypothetical protein
VTGVPDGRQMMDGRQALATKHWPRWLGDKITEIKLMAYKSAGTLSKRINIVQLAIRQ